MNHTRQRWRGYDTRHVARQVRYNPPQMSREEAFHGN